jgi:hypothetical protein
MDIPQPAYTGLGDIALPRDITTACVAWILETDHNRKLGDISSYLPRGSQDHNYVDRGRISWNRVASPQLHTQLVGP